MEKNVIAAFALSLLVIIAFSFLQQPSPPATVPAPVSDAPREAAPVFPPPAPDAPEAAAESPREAALLSAALVTVETDLYRARFDSLGARLVSFGLKHYTRADEDFLETLADDGFYPFEIPDFRSVVFAVDRDRLLLTADGPADGELVFTGVADGRKITKRFTFSNDRYGIGFALEKSGTDERETSGKRLAAFSQPVVRDRQQVDEMLAGVGGERPQRFRAGSLRGESRRFEHAAFLARRSQYTLTFLQPQQPLPAVFEGDAAGRTAAFYQLPPAGEGAFSFYFYSGPGDHSFLVRESADIAGLLPAGPMVVASRFILRVLTLFHRVIPNWGVAIILLTILFKVLFFPLTRTSLRTMKTMQKIQPMLKELSKKYKDNPQAMQKEMFGIYRHYKVNPMGGCLPMLLQIPVFIAIFVMLRSALVLRGASFMLWINDLSRPDQLFTVNDFPVNILPLLMGATMFLQQKLTGTAGGPGMGRQQQQMMMFMMPIMLTVFLYNLPSGLMLYWTTTNFISIAEHKLSAVQAK